jgi:hypothetical protein
MGHRLTDGTRLAVMGAGGVLTGGDGFKTVIQDYLSDFTMEHNYKNTFDVHGFVRETK